MVKKMRKYNSIKNTHWRKLPRQLSAASRLLLIYLITNDSTGPTGIQQYSIGRIKSDTHLSEKAVDSAITQLTNKGLVIVEDGYIWTPLRWQNETQRTGKVLGLVDDEMEIMPKAIKAAFTLLLDRVSDRVSDRVFYTERERESETEREREKEEGEFFPSVAVAPKRKKKSKSKLKPKTLQRLKKRVKKSFPKTNSSALLKECESLYKILSSGKLQFDADIRSMSASDWWKCLHKFIKWCRVYDDGHWKVTFTSLCANDFNQLKTAFSQYQADTGRGKKKKKKDPRGNYADDILFEGEND